LDIEARRKPGFSFCFLIPDRETEIKKWRREKKTAALIEKRNPTWEDLAAGWGEPAEMTFRPVH